MEDSIARDVNGLFSWRFYSPNVLLYYYIPAKSSRTLEKPKEVVEVSLEVAVVSLCCGGAGVEVKSLLEPLMEDSRLRSCTIRSPL